MVVLWEEAKEAAEVVVDEKWEKWRTGVYLCVLMVTVVVQEMVVVLLVVVVVVKCGDVVTRVAEKMLLVCVQCVTDGWIWICQCLRDVACDVNDAGVDVVIGVVICGVWNVLWWICGVICDVSDVVS